MENEIIETQEGDGKIKKATKFIKKHSKEIVMVGKFLVNMMGRLRHRKKKEPSEVPPTEEKTMEERMQVLESDLEALQNDFNSLSEDVEKLVVNLETIVEKLGNVEVELKATNRKILILSVLSAVGIVAAVVLAILL